MGSRTYIVGQGREDARHYNHTDVCHMGVTQGTVSVNGSSHNETARREICYSDEACVVKSGGARRRVRTREG